MTALEFTAGRENGRRRPRGYAEWRPHTKTRALLDEISTVLDEYEDHLPLTVRQIFYRLVGQYKYEKTEKAYARLAEVLVRARRARLIPFAAIRDDGVVTLANAFYAGVAHFHDETGRRARAYRRDRQAGQPQYIELWCEAGGMLQQLARVASQYSVPVYSCCGFNSLTANYAVGDRALRRDVPTTILHVGDFDPSGESIFDAMTEDAAAFVEADRVFLPQRIDPVRVALTAEQVSIFELPTAPPKELQQGRQKWAGATCQLEALAPDDLAAIVAEAIEHELRFDVYQDQIEIERIDRAQLLGLPRGGDR